MACGCGAKAANGGQYEVRPTDGTGVKTFTSKAEADVYAARSGGIVRRLEPTSR